MSGGGGVGCVSVMGARAFARGGGCHSKRWRWRGVSECYGCTCACPGRGLSQQEASTSTTSPGRAKTVEISSRPSHWRDCHSAASPSTFSRCFNSDGERASAK